MSRLRQFVSALMILAVVTMLNAPLLACEMAGHRCTMMAHPPKAAPQAHAVKAKHDCCPKEGSQTPSEKKQNCHGTPAALPIEAAASMSCCNMGGTPIVASVTPSAPVTKLMLIAVNGPPPDLFSAIAKHVTSPSPSPIVPRAVFDLKADLRI